MESSVRAATTRFALTFQLDWTPNAQFAGLLLAQERGWYRDAGLDVTFLPVEPSMKVVERVVSGTNWIGCSESGVLMAARASGAPIKAIGTMLQASPMALISLKTNGFTGFARLTGKTIGIHPDGQSAINLVLSHEGLRRDAFKIIEKSHDLGPLLDGRCAAVQGYIIDEVVNLENQGVAIEILPYYELGYSAYSQVYFTSDTFLRAHSDVLRTFLDVSRRGWQTAILEPEETANLIIEKYAPALNKKYQRMSLEKIARLSTLETGYLRMGVMSPSTWSRIVESFRASKILNRDVRVDEIADFTIANPLPTWPPQSRLRIDFHEPGGTYPDAEPPKRFGQNVPFLPLQMVAAVDPEGQATVVIPVNSGLNATTDAWWIDQVKTRWKWPTGPWREYRIEVPVAAP